MFDLLVPAHGITDHVVLKTDNNYWSHIRIVLGIED